MIQRLLCSGRAATRGRRPRLFFYRDRSGLEIDLIVEKGTDLVLVEVKSAQTPSGEAFSAFERFAEEISLIRNWRGFQGRRAQKLPPGP